MAEPQRGLFLRRETGLQEAEAFRSIRSLFDQSGTKSVALADPYLNADAIKLLLRLEHHFSFRIVTSLRVDGWEAFRQQLHRTEPFLHRSLSIHQASGHAGDQQFHDRYLIVENDSVRRVYALTNSFASLGAKQPIAVFSLEAKLALEVEDYVEELFSKAGAPWWPESASKGECQSASSARGLG